MNNRKEILEQKIAAAGPPSDLDRKELLTILGNPTMQRIIWGILHQSDESLMALGNIDLTTDVGVKTAIKLQARAAMFSAVAEHLIEFATTEPEVKENENDGHK